MYMTLSLIGLKKINLDFHSFFSQSSSSSSFDVIVGFFGHSLRRLVSLDFGLRNNGSNFGAGWTYSVFKGLRR